MRAKKRFGQHFLTNQALIHQLVECIRPLPGQALVEIGPGRGALTVPVLARCRRLEVIELDRTLVPDLQKLCDEDKHMIIHQADVLTFDFSQCVHQGCPLRIFGNLPYNISTPILFHLLPYFPVIADMHFMLQKEVVERMTAQPGERHYGRLSVMIQYHCQAQALMFVPPHAFEPPPKVDSMVLRLLPYKSLPQVAIDEIQFSKVVQCAFQHKRKTLKNNLGRFLQREAWESMAIDPNLRAENLSVADFVRISNFLSKASDS